MKGSLAKVLRARHAAPGGVNLDRLGFAELGAHGDALALGFLFSASHYSSIPMLNSGILESWQTSE